MIYIATALVECKTRTSQTLYLPQQRVDGKDADAALGAAEAWLAALDSAAVLSKMPHLKGVRVAAKTLLSVRKS